MAKKKGPKSITDEHKAAMAAGRAEGRAVKDYLEALESARPKRGRRRTPESIEKRLAAIDDLLPTADPVARLSLIQERNDLTAEMDGLTAEVDISELEAAFAKVAKAYSERKGIGYAAWREVGVPASVLKDAGISRAS
jgi:hypothetical protein